MSMERPRVYHQQQRFCYSQRIALRRTRQKCHHQALTETGLHKIQHSQALNPDTPKGIVNKVWFDTHLSSVKMITHQKPQRCQGDTKRAYGGLCLSNLATHCVLWLRWKNTCHCPIHQILSPINPTKEEKLS